MAPDMMTSSQQPPPTEDGADSNYAIAAAILAVILICIIIAVVLYSFCQRHNSIWYHCRLYLCPCSKPDLRNDDLSMGYLPAHITVNPGALQQGIPDIFLRDSQAGRISMEGNSYGSWRGGGGEGDSVTETSGMWAEYLRRATIRRRSSVGGRGGDRKSSSGEDDLPLADCGKSGADLDNRGITNGAMVINDVSNSRDDAMDESVRDDMNNVVNDGSGN